MPIRFRTLSHALLPKIVGLLTAVLPFPSVSMAQAGFVSRSVPGRYLVLYRDGQVQVSAAIEAERQGARVLRTHTRFGMAAMEMSSATAVSLAKSPEVEVVVQDRVVTAHRLLQPSRLGSAGSTSLLQSPQPASHLPRPVVLDPAQGTANSGGSTSGGSTNGGASNGSGTIVTPPPPNAPLPDDFYSSTPQGWAVKQAGGYGAGFAGGTRLGPWNTTLGAGVRIAVLDSGVDAAHPDIAPNLALNMSEVDPSQQPSACDDASPQDQQGHGTWVASLAAGAMGANTGRVIGVAPSAPLLNIKVLQRMPGAGAGTAAQCAAGEASGLVSWLIKGIDDAVSQHADVIVLSLGSIVDLYTGDGAGLKTIFDRATHAAAQAGVVIVAAAGNDGFDFSNTRYLELPAQARDVLAITATTNAECAEDNRTAASCAPGAVTRPYYANFGAPLQALAAPGGNYPVGTDLAVSGWVRGACSSGKPGTQDGPPADATRSFGCFNLGHASYVQAMGTSASAGLAAGAAALVRAAHPDWNASTVIAALRASAPADATPAVIQLEHALTYQPGTALQK